MGYRETINIMKCHSKNYPDALPVEDGGVRDIYLSRDARHVKIPRRERDLKFLKRLLATRLLLEKVGGPSPPPLENALTNKK